MSPEAIRGERKFSRLAPESQLGEPRPEVREDSRFALRAEFIPFDEAVVARDEVVEFRRDVYIRAPEVGVISVTLHVDIDFDIGARTAHLSGLDATQE